jgi:hypothetical protein
MENKAIYAKGMYFNKVKPETPDEVKKWKKGSIATHIDNHIEYLQSIKEYANDKGYVYHDFTLNEKDGESFFSYKLNTWKPEPKQGFKSSLTPEEAKTIEAHKEAGKKAEDEWFDNVDKDEIPF